MEEPLEREVDDLLDVVETQQKARRVLTMLLEEQAAKANHHFVLQVDMGEVRSYLTSVTLRWVAQKVGFAADLPIFAEGDVGSKRVHVGPDTLEKIQQRQPDWRRQTQMAAYLATRKHHKFPPLLLVGYQGWVFEEANEKWGVDGRAMNDSLTLGQLDLGGAYWDLEDSNTQFYALDGQHRLMAILGLQELVKTGHLPKYDENRTPSKRGGLSREELVRYVATNTKESAADIHERLQRLMDERIGVEIIPAVRQGEDLEEALRRLRQMFVDVNEHAKRLDRSQLALLDEADGFRVVARRVIRNSSDRRSAMFYSVAGEQSKVASEGTELRENSVEITTLNTLVDVVRSYLTENKTLEGKEAYASWGNLLEKGAPVRPDDPLLEQGTKDMEAYFEALAKLPSYIAFIQGKPASEIRSADGGDDNILFRPLVQVALAEALGRLVTRGVSLHNAVEELGRQEDEGQLKLTQRKTPWFGVLCDPITLRMRRYKKNRNLCSQMFEYLLGSGVEDDFDREKLREAFARERTIDVDKGDAVDMAGNVVPAADVLLPNPWR